LFGETAAQLLCCQFYGLVIGGELESKPIAVNSNSQPRRTSREIKQGAQFFLAEFVDAPLNPQEDTSALIGD
jgi:hypothetical protein